MNTLPNWLTLARIIVIPLVIAAFYLPGDIGNWLAFGLFLAASLTDYFDGYLARRQNATSPLGRFLDPIADKLLVAATLLMLVFFDRAPVLATVLIVCREILVSGLREFLAERQVPVPVSRLAKWKTATQMVAICFLLLGTTVPNPILPDVSIQLIGFGLLWLAAVLTLMTGFDYLRAGLRHMAEPQQDHAAP